MEVNEALLMDLADCGSPERLLAVILDHHRDWKPPVDVETFARSVGIIEFRDLEVDGFVGALMTDMEKTKGIILSATGMPEPRRRFTISHELGHFLIAAHRGDKRCSAKDMYENGRETHHQKEEAQANRFAAGLLMPKPWFVAQTDEMGGPDLSSLHVLASTYGVSLEAAANRYADLTPEACAFVFIKDGRIRYSRPSRTFPAMIVRRGEQPPSTAMLGSQQWGHAATSDWLLLKHGKTSDLQIQVLSQKNGFRTVLLHIEDLFEEEDEEEDIVDRFKNRFARLNTRP